MPSVTSPRRPVAALLAVLLVLAVLSGCSSRNQQASTIEPGVFPGATRLEPQGPAAPGGGPAAPGGGPAASGGTAQPGGTFADTLFADPVTLNPLLANDLASNQVISYLFDGLIGFNDKLEPVPRLAERWTVSADGLTWTFKLRQGVEWHDGQPFTARDVLFTYQSLLHPGYTGPGQAQFTALKGGSAYFARFGELKQQWEQRRLTDQQYAEQVIPLFEQFMAAGGLRGEGDTVIFTLEQPFAPFLTSVAKPIVPEHLLREHQGALMKGAPFNARPVGTGRFKFQEWVKGSHVSLVKNAKWPGGAPLIEAVVLKVLPDNALALRALEAGEVDRGGAPADARWQARFPDIQVYEQPSFVYVYFGYNHRLPLFQDRRVRQAFAHAVDRLTMVNSLIGPQADVAHTHSLPSRWDYNRDVPIFDYKPDRAAALLDEAGWRASAADGVRTKDGQRLSFTITVPQGFPEREQAAFYIAAELAQVGVEVKGVEVAEWSHFLDRVGRGEVEAYIVGWSLSLDPDPYQIFHSRGGSNKMHGFKDPKVDELIERGRRTLAQEERRKIYHELQRLLSEEQVYMWLWYSKSFIGLNSRVKGPITVSPAGMDWNFEKWWLEKK